MKKTKNIKNYLIFSVVRISENNVFPTIVSCIPTSDNDIVTIVTMEL